MSAHNSAHCQPRFWYVIEPVTGSSRDGDACAACALEQELLTLRVKSGLLGTGPTRLRLGNFDIERCLGQGSSGVVFAAVDLRSGEQVALKHFHTSAGAHHIKREFRARMGVSHHNLVSLHELFAHERGWFLTMELIEGSSFADYVRPEGRVGFDAARLRSASLQLLEGVAAIHAAGRVHRDLKPANTLVAQDGRVIILDYGLMQELDPERTHTTRAVGTRAYMPPEQLIRVQPSQAGDVYAVGMMLFEALTGRLPSEASLRSAAPKLRQSVRRRAPDLAALCEHLLEREPQTRPSASEALRQLACAPPPEPPACARDPDTGFFGRDTELAVLRTQLDLAGAGQPMIVLLEGESGVGKSALLRRFREQIELRGAALVLEGRCCEREHVRFNALDDVVQQLALHLTRSSASERARVLPRELRALSRLFPALCQLALDDVGWPAERELPTPDPELEAFNALRELFTRMCRQKTLVICLDDMQWSDHDSMRLWRHVLAGAHAPPLLLLCAYRRGALQHVSHLAASFGPRARGLARAPTLIELGALQSEDTRRLIDLLGSRALAPPLRDAIARESRGIPFLIRELVEYHAAELVQPTAAGNLAAMLVARRARRSPDAQRVLDVLCVAGRPLPLEVASAAVACSAVGAAVARELCDAKLAKLWQETPDDQLELYHDRMREALSSQLDATSIRELHRGIADAFARLAADRPEEQIQHRFLAGERELAARLALSGARRAEDLLAWNRAAELLRMALEWADPHDAQRREQLERLAAALSHAGRHSEAADVYCGLAQPGVNGPARYAVGLAYQQVRAGRTTEGLSTAKLLYRRLGLYFPDLRSNPAWMYLRARAGVRLSRPAWGMRRCTASAREAEQLQAIEVLLPDLISADPIRARILHGQYYRLALRRGEPIQVLHALFWEISHVGYLQGSRGRGRMRRLLSHASELVDRVATGYARGLGWFVEGVVAYTCNESPGRALAAFRRAESLLARECAATHFSRESLALWRSMVAELTGDFGDLLSIAATRSSRDETCSERGLPLQVQGVPFGLLLRDQPSAALRFLEARATPGELSLLNYFCSVRAAEVAFYMQHGSRAARLIDDLRDSLRRSVLRLSPLFRSSFAFYDARSAAAQYFETRDPSMKHRVQRELQRTHGAAAPRYNRGFVRLVQAGMSLADGCVDDARNTLRAAVMDFSVGEAFHGAVCARYRLAQLERSNTRLRSAESWLQKRGVVDPEQWVSVWAPIPHGA